MTLTLELPEELAARLNDLPAEERHSFSIAAIDDALTCLYCQIEPEEGDWIEQVNQAIDEIEAGDPGIPFEEVCRQWDAEKASRRAKEAA